MRSTGIRDLKNNLSRHLRALRPGEVLRVTDRGRVIAEIRATSEETGLPALPPLIDRYAALVRQGVIRAGEAGDPLEDWPSSGVLKLQAGTAAALLDEDRGP